MAREQANIVTSIWADRGWRELPQMAKYLYLTLLTHPTITYAGVVDWRASKLAMLSPDTTAEDIENTAHLLQDKRYVFIDEESEEILLRSYLRHDGILKQPKLSVSMVNAYAAVSSVKIQDVIVFELHRLRGEYPEWAAWRSVKVQAMLKHPGQNMDVFTLNAAQGFTHRFTLNAGQAVAQAQGLRTATTTTTATSTPYGVDHANEPNRTQPAGQNGTRIPANFKADTAMIAWAMENTPNVNWRSSTQKFKSHYRSVAGRQQFKTDWDEAWKAWILGDQEKAEARPQQFKTAAQQKMDAANTLFMQYQQEENETPQAIEAMK